MIYQIKSVYKNDLNNTIYNKCYKNIHFIFILYTFYLHIHTF